MVINELEDGEIPAATLPEGGKKTNKKQAKTRKKSHQSAVCKIEVSINSRVKKFQKIK